MATFMVRDVGHARKKRRRIGAARNGCFVAAELVEAFDAMIAAIALVPGADIATRDVGGFEGLGLTLIDPWASV